MNYLTQHLNCTDLVNLILYLPSLNQQIAMWLTNQTDLYYYLHMGIGSDSVLYDVLVGFNAQMVRQALVDANGTNAIFNWFYNNSQQQVLQLGAKHAHGLVSAWQTAQAPQSMAAYFGFVQQYYGQSAYDFILQLYQAASKTYLDSFNLSEWHIYGSARLGIYQTYLNLVTAKFNANAGSGGTFTEVGYGSAVFATVNYQLFSLQRGEKVYELTNHLGNVLVTISDKRLPQCSATVVTGHTAYVISATDYSAFGAPLPGRTFAGEGYRFGFNGKEKDDETYGTGNEYDYGFRIYNPRLGKFLSVDPLTKDYPWYTPYQFAGNKPIWAIDLDGLEEKIYQETLKDNWGFKAIMAIADQTTLGKEFNDVLKSQNKVDVYYFTFSSKMMISSGGDMGDRVSVNSEGFAEGNPGATLGVTAPTVVYNIDDFYKLSSKFSMIDPKDLEGSFKTGKGVVLIGVTEGVINAPKTPDFNAEKFANFRTSGAEILLHEDWAHGRTLLQGQNIGEKQEHKAYHGNYSKTSPSATELMGSKYSLTNAGKAIKEMNSIVKKSYNKK